MRAFVFAWIASLALAACAPPPAASPAEGRPQRVASLNLCTDELLLLLADPEQIVSVSHLSQREPETLLWRQAQAFAANDGSLASALPLRPDLVLTMGGAGDRGGIAGRIGLPIVDLAFPRSIDDIAHSIRRVAGVLGQDARGETLIAGIARLRAGAPGELVDTLWIGGGGRTVAADGLEAQWMAMAGLRQRAVSGDQVQLETLLADPPAILLRSDYRPDQHSRAQAWLHHPLAQARQGSRTAVTDGRPWTCMGPPMIEEIERLRRELAE